jgi:hypothetical protein
MSHRRTLLGILLAALLSILMLRPLAAQNNGLGVGRGDGQEVGIRLDALERIRQDIQTGVYDRPCTAAEHDPNVWHTIVNVERGCHYDHHHGDDPGYVNDIFGTPGEWFGMAGKSVSYPWQTFRSDDMYGGNTQAIAERRMENDLKHEGYLWFVRRDQPCPNGYCITDFRLQTHAIFGAHDAPVRYHSYSFEARVCADAARPETCGIVRVGGWVNTGRLFLTNADDIGCGFGQELIHIPLSADNLYFPVDTDNIDESRCHSTLVNNLPQIPGTQPLAEWWTHNPGDRVRFQVRNYDPLGNIDPTDPGIWQVYCDQFTGDCPYDQSMSTVWIGYVLKVRGENYGDVYVEIDPDRDAIGNYRGYTDRWGGMRLSCTTVGLDCIPLEYSNVHLDPVFAEFGEGSFTHEICDECPKVDYDLSPPGVNWLTWYRRYLDHNDHGTPTPIPSATPVPSAFGVRAVVNDSDIQPGETVTIAFLLDQPAGSAGIQALEAACTVDNPGVVLPRSVARGTLFAPDSLVVTPGIVDNRFVFAVTQTGTTPPVTGSGTLLSASIFAVREGEARLNCDIRAVDASESEISVPFSGLVLHVGHSGTPQPTLTPPPDPTMTSLPPTITPIPPTATPIPPTATPQPGNASIAGVALRSHASDIGIAIALLQNGSVVAETQTDAQGRFVMSNLAAGSYVVTATTPGYLGAEANVTLTDGQTLELGTATLLAGDVFRDARNVIDELDVVQLVSVYGQTVPPADAAFDLTLDGRVGILDLRALALNLRATGPVTWG